MKFTATLVVAALICIVAASWFAEPDEEIDATQAAAVSSGFDPGQPTDGNDETPQQRRLRQPGVPSEESVAHRDVGSDSAISNSPGSVPLAVPGTGQVAVRNATETVPGQATDVPSVEPPAIDKTACEAAAKTLSESLSIFDVTPTQAIWYARPRPSDPVQVNAFTHLKARLLAPLCSGTDAFDRAYPVESEFVAISAEAHVRILVGDHWISDGTVLSFLPEADQNFFGGSILQRRRAGPGPNVARDSFERQLARNPQSLLVGP
jgi:hypothetical protein